MFLSRIRVSLFAVTFVAVFSFVFSAATAQVKAKKSSGGGSGTKYQIIPLDDDSGYFDDGMGADINDDGLIVGYVDEPDQTRRAAAWSINRSNASVSTSLTLLANGIFAYSANDQGGIVGQGVAADQLVGMYWPNAQAAPYLLPPLQGHDRSGGLAINEEGVVCGFSALAGDATSMRAVVWRVNTVDGSSDIWGPAELPGGFANALALNDIDANNSCQTVGYQNQNPLLLADSAVMWNVHTQSDGSLAVSAEVRVLNDNARAFGINNFGAICGGLDNEAIEWIGNTATLLKKPRRNAATTSAFDLNRGGVIVGIGGPGSIDRRAVVWPSSDDEFFYLDKYLGRNSPLSGLSSAEAVNEDGEIVGKAWKGGFLAIPE